MLPYVAPMFAFLVLTNLEGYLPGPAWYPLAYAAQGPGRGGRGLDLPRRPGRDLRPLPPLRSLVLAIMIGLIVFVLWVRLEGWYPALSFLGKRTGFDPGDPAARLEVAVRRRPVLRAGAARPADRGAVLAVVPDPLADQPQLPRRCRSARSPPSPPAITSAVFALSHPEWLPALLTGPALGLAALADEVALGLRRQPRRRQPRPRPPRPHDRRLEVLVSPEHHPVLGP